MKLFGMCIDKRVVIGVIAAAGLLWWFAPGAFAAALPLLVFAICPLSMLLMMKAMSQMGSQQPPVGHEPQPAEVQAPQGAPAGAIDVESRRN